MQDRDIAAPSSSPAEGDRYIVATGATDAANPFAAKLNGAFRTARTVPEGGSGDLRLTRDKETAAGVLSFLLPSGFSGRAELGLLGSDDLSLKVSPDGVA